MFFTVAIDHKKPIPLYQQVADSIRADVMSGRIESGEQLGSHHALARKYEVSLITIKRALNDLVRDGILYSRAGKGTFVHDTSATRLSLGTKTIGLVLRDLKSPFFSLITQSVEEYASQKGYILLLSNSSQQIEKEENFIRHFHEIGVSGLIIASMSHEYTASALLREIFEKNYPCIVVSYFKDPDVYFVGTDHEQGAYMATRHLLSVGHRSIGYVDGELGNVVGELRKKGYLRALAEKGLSVPDQFIFRLRERGEEHDYSSGYEVGKIFAKQTGRPEAMFIYNDLAALGFEQAVLDSGLQVPDDVAIIGFDGIERGQYARVPLTTIQQPFDRIGALAVENLIKRIEGKPVEIKTVLEPRLIIRESCGAHKKG
jgi:DNA-binding LacI/PurR family transcriptional regulator